MAIARVNSTKHADYQQYLTPKAEEAIYQRYRWLFDSGFYSRETAWLNNLPSKRVVAEDLNLGYKVNNYNFYIA